MKKNKGNAYNYYKSAKVAATAAKRQAAGWTLYYGEPCDSEGLMRFSSALDSENPMTEDECYYVTNDEGSLGMTINNGGYVAWLATASIPAPIEEKGEFAPSPWIVIKETVRDKVKGLRKIFTLKGLLSKVLITGGLMLVMWIVTALWERYCLTHGQEIPDIVNVLAYLTFANGGMSTDTLYMVGGFFGKTFVMTTLIAVIVGGIKKVGKGIGVMFKTFKTLRFKLFLAGAGSACILYNFFVGSACIELTMAAIAGILSMLWAMGGGVHFIRRMTVALTARVNKQSRVHYIDMPKVNSVLTGMTVGFLASIALSVDSLGGCTPYIFGIICLLLAVVLKSKSKAKKVPGVAGAIYAMVLMASPMAANGSDWYLELDRVLHLSTSNETTDVEFGQGYIKYFYHDQVDHNWAEDGVPQGYLPDVSIYYRYSVDMPTIIKQGDKITCIAEREKDGKMCEANEASILGFYAFKDPDNPPKDGAHTGRYYNIDKKFRFRSTEKKEDYIGTKCATTISFNKDCIFDPKDPDKEAPDGTEFVITIGNYSVGTVAYVYKYHHGTLPEAVIIVGPSNEEGAIDVPSIAIILIGSGGAGALAILIALGGAGAAAKEEKDNPTVPKEPRPSDPYVVTQPDGTIEYTNPITLERDYYPQGTDENEVREQVEHVLRNRDYYKSIQDKHDQTTKEQREQIQREIDQRRAAYERAEAEKAARENAHQDYVAQLKEKYGVKTDQELRDKIGEAMAKAERDYCDNIGDAEAYDKAYKFTAGIKIVADVAMDGLAAFGGTQGAMIRDAYKAAAEISQTMVDAGCRGKNMGEAVAVGITRASITYFQYQTLEVGVIPHLGSTVVGEGVRDAVTALYEGKSPQEVADAYFKGTVRGAENFSVDTIVGGIGKAAGNSSKVMNSADYKTAQKAINSLGNMTDDVGKIYFDDKLS